MKNNDNTIKYEITTKSNCLIGSQNITFSIGGVDQSTTIDENGRPIIYGSAIKGILRSIAREKSDSLVNCKKLVEDILREIKRKYDELDKKIKEEETVKKVISFIELKFDDIRGEDIFGIGGLNQMPSLLFSDVRVDSNENRKPEEFFLIDTKNALEEVQDNIISKPRTYKVIKPGVKLVGYIRFTKFEGYDVNIRQAKKEIEEMLNLFNEQEYSIGNSKSRGYGNIKVEIIPL